MNEKTDYHISFFKPTTERASINRNMVILLVSIWAVAIFGFHFLLRIIEKPTPEPVLIEFQSVWDNVKTDQANNDELRIFANSVLQVAGKVFIAPEHREALDNGLSWAVYSLADSAQKVAILDAMQRFEHIASEIESLTDQNYLETKNELAALASNVLHISPEKAIHDILPLELRASAIGPISDKNKSIIESCIPLYTIHNQSVLTDFTFLGFPFHYFYTAVFLLVLFIGICWYYCIKTDQLNKRLNINE